MIYFDRKKEIESESEKEKEVLMHAWLGPGWYRI